MTADDQAGTSPGGEVTVAIVDDDAIVRDWIRHSLDGSEFRVVGEAESADEALRVLDRRRPSLLILDYRLPDRRATELLRSLRQEGVRIPVLVMTATRERGLNEAVREAGGDGVVLKRGDSGALLRALRAVGMGKFVQDGEHPRRAVDRSPLSPREREVLRLAADGATNSEIGARLGLGTESVKTFLTRTFTKLGVRNRMEAVARAREQGLL